MITKDQFDSLFDENIKKKDYDEIIRLIDERFEEICERFLIKKNRSAWYSYGNLSYTDEDDEGFFDPHDYKEFIEVAGEYIEGPPGYDLSFPTSWLWAENWEQEMKETSECSLKTIQKEKEVAKKKREDRKDNLARLRISIESKLTPEELKAIKFKK